MNGKAEVSGIPFEEPFVGAPKFAHFPQKFVDFVLMFAVSGGMVHDDDLLD
jgi:hypothetical protein